MILGMTYYQLFGYFLIYSLIGWAVEVAYHVVKQGRIINRGFLAGPVCPVYGVGMVLVFGVIDRISGVEIADIQEANAAVVFFAGMVLASAVEFIGGWGLYHAFHARWWDYRDRPFNLGGYICLEFSIYWGIGALLVVRVLHPVIDGLSTGLIPEKYGWPLMAVFYLVYLTDFIVSVLIVLGLNRRIARLDELRASMRIVSDDLSEWIGESTLESMTRIDEGRVQAALARAELRDSIEERKEETERELARGKVEYERMKEETIREFERRREEHERELAKRKAEAEQIRASIRKHSFFGSGRILKAFPGLSYDNETYDEITKELREEMK